MRNIRLLIEYDGADFAGWQRQPHAPTIQATIEDCLAGMHGRKIIVYGASRTDSGVHARGQVANFYTDLKVPPERWGAALNTLLPPTIRVQEAVLAPPEFFSQRNVLDKTYEYRLRQRSHASALDRRALFYPGALDWEAIRASLPQFVGEKDFRAFQGAKSQVLTTRRTIYAFDVVQQEDGLFLFRIRGNGFLKQMVRTIMGTVLEVGEGKRRPEGISAIILSRDRARAGRTLPAHGLFLAQIRYHQG